jgi:hypothetical protein
MAQQNLQETLYADILPIARRISATDRYAITIGGSRGKGVADMRSDYDFRIYYETRVHDSLWNAIMEDLERCMRKWREQGIEIDGIWPRSIDEIDRELDLWLSGNGSVTPIIWSVWGYHLLTDIYNQAIVEDPCGIAQAWKERLSRYPDALRDSIIERHGASLRYWRNDYHFHNKSVRRDHVFMASITARLVHDMMQVIYALNRFYYPGDGLNLTYTQEFALKPERLNERVIELLYPGRSQDCTRRQYEKAIALIDDVLALIESA